MMVMFCISGRLSLVQSSYQVTLHSLMHWLAIWPPWYSTVINTRLHRIGKTGAEHFHNHIYQHRIT